MALAALLLPTFSQLQVTFSEPVNPIDASAPAEYQLRKAGSNGFGSADDVVYALTPVYTPGTDVVTLDIGGLEGGTLPVGEYRFTIFSNSTSSIHDLSGNPLDGDDNGTAANFVRTFAVTLVIPTTVEASTLTDIFSTSDQQVTLRATVTSTDGSPINTGTVTFGVYQWRDPDRDICHLGHGCQWRGPRRPTPCLAAPRPGITASRLVTAVAAPTMSAATTSPMPRSPS